MSNPLVSVVTPSFRHACYLHEYFDGLLAQTYRNIEVIFVNDGSPDDTSQIAMAYQPRLNEHLARMVLINQSNQGMLGALKRGLAEATGELVSILESDDYWLPTKCAENIRYLTENPKCGLVHSDVDIIHNGAISCAVNKSARKVVPTGAVFHDLLKVNFVTTCTTCMRHDLFRKHVDVASFAFRRYLMADYPIWLEIANRCQVGYIDKPLARYRILPESASHSADPRRMRDFDRSALQIRLDYLNAHAPQKRSRERLESARAVASDLCHLAYQARQNGAYLSAAEAFLTTLSEFGPNAPAILGLLKLGPHLFLSRLRKFMGGSRKKAACTDHRDA